MSLQDDIRNMEQRIADAGTTVAAFCRDMGIARSTWDRWKSGQTEPSMRLWRRVLVAMEQLQSANAHAPSEATP